MSLCDCSPGLDLVRVLGVPRRRPLPQHVPAALLRRHWPARSVESSLVWNGVTPASHATLFWVRRRDCVRVGSRAPGAAPAGSVGVVSKAALKTSEGRGEVELFP